jgi:hypothetical protein
MPQGTQGQEGEMPSLSRSIDVEVPATVAQAAWGQFVEWVRVGDGRFSCDAFTCERALEAGVVAFQPLSADRARVAISFAYDGANEPDDGRHARLHGQIGRDLVRFKEFVEVEGSGRHRHTHEEHVAMSEAEIVSHAKAPRENAGHDIDSFSRRRVFNQ